jgi:hypothetical protein
MTGGKKGTYLIVSPIQVLIRPSRRSTKQNQHLYPRLLLNPNLFPHLLIFPSIERVIIQPYLSRHLMQMHRNQNNMCNSGMLFQQREERKWFIVFRRKGLNVHY